MAVVGGKSTETHNIAGRQTVLQGTKYIGLHDLAGDTVWRLKQRFLKNTLLVADALQSQFSYAKVWVNRSDFDCQVTIQRQLDPTRFGFEDFDHWF